MLIYAHADSFSRHQRVRQWLDSRINGTAPVGFPWPSLLAFMRIISNPRIFQKPESIESAWQQVGEWLQCPPAWIPAPTSRHHEILAPLLLNQAVRPNLIPDAHLAALAIEHGLILCSPDGDFARFPGLRWENPLASG